MVASNASFFGNLDVVATTGVPVSISFGAPNVPSLTGLALVAQGITGRHAGRMPWAPS